MTYSGLEKIAKGTMQQGSKALETEAGFQGNALPQQKRTLMRDAVEGLDRQESTSLVGEAINGNNVGFSENVPDAYEIHFADGMRCDENLLAAATPIFKAMKLTQKQAQQLAELHASHVRKMEQSYAETIQAWREAAQKDPELGGPDYPKKLAVIAKTAKAFGSKTLFDLLDTTGIGNHPEVLRLFYRIGCALEQDGFTTGSNKVSGADPISLVYPKLKPY